MATDLNALQRQLKLTFRRPELLAEAIVHRSYLNEAPDPTTVSNERLEFLGDAVLGLVVARWLFTKFPHLQEGRLTELRSHLVKSASLSRVAARLDLGAYLLLGRGEEASGGRTRALNLARALESIIAAVFLDRGFQQTERWLLRVLGPDLRELAGGELPPDAKSELQHTAQRLYGATPRYQVVDIEGPDHQRTYTIEVMLAGRSFGAGRGRSKQLAQMQAAQAALATIAEEEGTGGEADAVVPSPS